MLLMRSCFRLRPVRHRSVAIAQICDMIVRGDIIAMIEQSIIAAKLLPQLPVLFVMPSMLSITLEESQDILHRQPANALAAFYGCLGELAFAFLELNDSLLHAVTNGQPEHLHVDRLVESVNAVDRLLLHERVPQSPLARPL